MSTSEEMARRLNEAFMLGFMITREGFNGECAYDLAPSSPSFGFCDTVEEFRERMEAMPEYRKLRDMAMASLKSMESKLAGDEG